jgi:peptidoglycan hydrolase CwlO-like protein
MIDQLQRELKEVRAEMEKGQAALKQCQVHIQHLSNQLLELTELMQASVEGGSND